MDEDDYFDDDLLKAVEHYESTYKSQVSAPAQQQHAAGAACSAQPQKFKQTSGAWTPALAAMQTQHHTQALHPGHSSGFNPPWQLFCSSVPPVTSGSSCSGWAAKATKYLQQKPRSGATSIATQRQPTQHQQQHNVSDTQRQHQQAQHQQPVQGQPCQQQPSEQQTQYQQQQWRQPQQQFSRPNFQQQQQQQPNRQPWPSGQEQHSAHQQSQCARQQLWQQQQQQPWQQQQQFSQQQQMGPPHASLHGDMLSHSASTSHWGAQQGAPPRQQQPGSNNSCHQGAVCSNNATAGAFGAAGSTVTAGAGSAGCGAAGAHSGAGAGAEDPAGDGSSAMPAGAASGAGGPLALASGAGAAGSTSATAGASAPTSGAGAASAGSGGPAASGGPSVLVSARLGLGPKGTIEIEFSSDHPVVANACGSILGAVRGQTRGWKSVWLIPADQVQQLEKKLQELPADSVRVARFTPLPDFVCKILNSARKQPDDSELYQTLKQLQLAPGESLEQRMMPFQREGVKFGLRVGGRLLIGDEMGLGKTVQACALALCYKAEWPVLVITPSSLRLSWAASLYDWIRVTENRVLVMLKKMDGKVLADARDEQHARSMFDFVVVSYDLLKDCEELFHQMAFKVVICDESHCIKNPKAIRSRLAGPMIKRAKRAILLSGTPALSRPAELYTQLDCLMPSAKIAKGVFEDRYAEIKQFGNYKKVTGSKNEEELNKLLTSTVMIRRRKAEVLKDLPPKLRKQVLLLLPQKERTQLDKLKKQLQEVRQATANIHSLGAQVGGSLLHGLEQEQHNMIMNLYHQTAKIKADAVADYVAEMVQDMSSEDDKFLVFAYHKELMAAIERGVNGVKQKNKEFKNLKYMRIDGSTAAKQREANVNMFQNDADCRVAILNIKAAGVGLTLTRASTVVFAELAWTPSEVQQAEDRAHRIGQTNCVSVQLLLVKDSIDEVMWEMLQSKLATTGQVLDGQAERLEVDKSGSHRPKGAASSWQAGSTKEDNMQKSITNFFAPNSGGARAEASKRQRIS